MEKSDLTPSNIVDKLALVGAVALAPGKESKSTVWKNFALMNSSMTGHYCGSVQCMNCKSVFKHNKATRGNTHLSVHLERCTRAACFKTATDFKVS